MTEPVVLNSEISLQTFIGELRAKWNKHKFLRVTVRTGKARSLDQNAISHTWYEQIERELREDDKLGVKCFCKPHFGVPILRAASEEFREFYNAAFLHTLTYEQKITAMKFIPVTSLMETDQLSQYLVAMQDHFRGRGVMLEFPPEDQKPKRRRA